MATGDYRREAERILQKARKDGVKDSVSLGILYGILAMSDSPEQRKDSYREGREDSASELVELLHGDQPPVDKLRLVRTWISDNLEQWN